MQATCSLEEKLHLKEGRLTLIKSSLASLPVYQMSLFRIPMSVVKKVGKVAKEVSLQWQDSCQEISLVDWDIVCSERVMVGWA